MGGSSATYSYQWYNGAGAAVGTNSSSYTPPVATTGTTSYYCIVTINPATSTGCSTTSTAASIIVNPAPLFTTQPVSQTICIDGTLNVLSVNSSGGTGTPTYQWYSNTTNSNTGGTAIALANLPSYTLPASLNTTAAVNYYYCELNFGTSGGCTIITSNVAAISVLVDPIFSVQPLNTQSICQGGIIAPLSFTLSGGSGTPSYQWYTVAGGTYNLITTNSTSSTYTPPIFNTIGTYNFAVQITQNISGCISAYSTNAQVVVVSDPIVTAPLGASYCQNSATVVPLSVSALGGS
ncbi:MAG: hypothetical protein EBY31_01015, partial [Flavobacteriia bacterium]|nr:hypothetical protein [Flavobacteriia bacterium]